MTKIKRALISLYYKEEALPLCRYLHHIGVDIVASGGTARFLSEHQLPVTRVREVTQHRDFLGGRVKTLHPKIFGGILARRNRSEDLRELEELAIQPFDLIVVNLYPFQEAVEKKQPLAQAVELIDIGGSALIRAAAKNALDVTVIVDREGLIQVERELRMNDGCTSLNIRLKLAVRAFQCSSAYDHDIAAYFQSFLNSD